MVKPQLPARQRIRKVLIMLAFLSFPVTMNYLSPYVIIEGAANGIVNGSLVMFGLLFASALFLGRAWCGWICPGGAMQELAEPVNNAPINGRKSDWIKWAIWFPWVGIIVWAAIQAGGYRSVDLLYHTQSGISVAGSPDRPILFAYIIYYGVVGLFVGLAMAFGRRVACHTVCWMAPFMILGRKLRNALNTPALRLSAATESCIHCQKCTAACSMSLDVHGMVQARAMEHSECILCGACADTCPKDVIHYAFSRGKD